MRHLIYVYLYKCWVLALFEKRKLQKDLRIMLQNSAELFTREFSGKLRPRSKRFGQKSTSPNSINGWIASGCLLLKPGKPDSVEIGSKSYCLILQRKFYVKIQIIFLIYIYIYISYD